MNIGELSFRIPLLSANPISHIGIVHGLLLTNLLNQISVSLNIAVSTKTRAALKISKDIEEKPDQSIALYPNLASKSIHSLMEL